MAGSKRTASLYYSKEASGSRNDVGVSVYGADRNKPVSASALILGEVVRCRWCKGTGDYCGYCQGRGLLPIRLERFYMGLAPNMNVKVRTEVLEASDNESEPNPRALSEVFSWPYEMDIRLRSIEQNHEQLNELKEGDTLDWEYQGYTFRTKVIERREAPIL